MNAEHQINVNTPAQTLPVLLPAPAPRVAASTEAEAHEGTPVTHPAQVTPPPVSPSTLSPQPSTCRRSPRGKIARLPKATRDRLNFMLRDGLKHKDALAGLGDQANGISIRNVSNWHISPAFQHWLLEQEWLESLRGHQESAFDLLNDFDACKFNEAALQLAVTRLFLALRHIETGGLDDKLGGNARTFAGLVHALARASRETTNLEKYRSACAQAVAAELKQMNTDRELADNEFQLLVKRMDRVFKVARPSSTAPATTGIPAPAAPKPPGEGGPAPQFKVESSALDVQCSQPSTLNPQPSTAQSVSPTLAAPKPSGEGGPAPQFKVESSALDVQCSQPSTLNPQPSTAQSVSPTLAAPKPSGEGGSVPQFKVESSNLDVQSSQPSALNPQPSTLSSPLKTQNSKPESCPACKILLPPLLKNGERAIPVCPKCGSGLPCPPRWTPFRAPSLNADASVCDLCRERHRLDPSGLPDPCPECGFYLLTRPATQPLNNGPP